MSSILFKSLFLFNARLFGLLIFSVNWSILAAAQEPAVQLSPRSLKDAVGQRFKLGVGIGNRVLENQQDTALMLQHFEILTPENSMKPEYLQPMEGRWNFAETDHFADFIRSNQLEMVGHCLVWAKDDRTAAWMKEYDTEPVTQERLLSRIELHVETVVRRYRDVVTMWDVVNEALGDGDEGLLRDSVYSRTSDIEFMVKAFEAARKHAPNALLIYNDYNGHKPGKREKLLELIRQLQSRNVPIDAYGMQGHFQLGDDSLQQLRETFDELRKLGIKVVVSELDIDVVGRDRWWAEGGKFREELRDHDPYRLGMPADIEQQLAEQYLALFQLFNDYQDIIVRVSFWNLHDGNSWLNYFPWNRTNHPLLFDRHRQPKKAFETVYQFLK